MPLAVSNKIFMREDSCCMKFVSVHNGAILQMEAVMSESEALAIPSKIEQVLIGGDLSKLNEGERVQYYTAVCKSIGLNPLTKPFSYIVLNSKLVLYANKDCTEQMRNLHGVSVTKIEKETQNGVYIVTAYVKNSTGREDAATGAVFIEGMKGDYLANALMKAETKAKRRATLSICGLGILDETEIETIKDAKPEEGFERKEQTSDGIKGNDTQKAGKERGAEITSYSDGMCLSESKDPWKMASKKYKVNDPAMLPKNVADSMIDWYKNEDAKLEKGAA